MLDYINLIPNPYAENFNMSLIDGTFDTPISEFVISAMREFEIIENIKIEYVKIKDKMHMDEIDYNIHTININYKKKNLEESLVIPKNKYITTSTFGEIEFGIRITTNKNEKFIVKKILYPEMIDGYYYNLNKKMTPILQLLEASTYGQRGKITLKSRMPIIIYHTKYRLIEDVNGEQFVMPMFSYALDTKSKARKTPTASKKKNTRFFNPLMIFCAKMGWRLTRDFWNMTGIVDIVTEFSEKEMDDFYFFPLNFCYVKVDKYFYDKYPEVRSFTGMTCHLGNKDYGVRYNNLEDKEYWICRIGYVGSAKNSDISSFKEKGKTTIYMIERLLDQTTINNLRVPGVYKHNIYYLIAWMIQNYDELKKKRNMDMESKRFRRNEYIVSSSLGKKINENINKFVESLNKSGMNTIDTLLELFNFNSDIILSGMRNNNDVIKTNEIVNDMTLLLDLAWTSKGPNSMGEKNGNKIPIKYRYIDSSMVGKLELNITSNNDVGLSGNLTPYVKTYDNFYFTEKGEPAEAMYLFEKELAEENHKDWTYHTPYDLSSFENYIDSINELDPFRKYLQYEKLIIEEREDE